MNNLLVNYVGKINKAHGGGGGVFAYHAPPIIHL